MKIVFLSLNLALCGLAAQAQEVVPTQNITPSPAATLGPIQATTTTATSALKLRSLSLAEALVLARQYSPTMEAARARVEAAQARLQVARAFPNPTLALALPFAVTGGRGATGGFDEGVVASQIIEGPGKRSARTSTARNERSASLFDLAGSGTSLDFTVKSAYFDALRFQNERDVAQQTLVVAQEFLRATTEQEQAGDVPRRDVLRAQTEADRAQSAFVQSEADLTIRLQTLGSLIGTSTGETLQLSDTLVSDTLAFAPAQFDEKILSQWALERRADVQSAEANLAAREADIKGSKAARNPDLFIEGRVAQLVPQSGDTRGSSLRVGVSLPLFDFGSIKAGVAVAKAGAEEQRANLVEVQRTARLEVQTALQTLKAARQNVEAFQNGRLQRAQNLLDLARTGYAEGASSLLDVLDARNVYRAEQADYNRALAAYNTAYADVERSVGGTLPTDLIPSPSTPTTLIPSSGTNLIPQSGPAPSNSPVSPVPETFGNPAPPILPGARLP